MRKIKMSILSIILLAVIFIMPSKFAGAAEGDVYTVTYNLTGAVVSPTTSEVTEGSGLDVAFTAESGYMLPDKISVTMAGTELSSYIYENGSLIINGVYGNLVITVNAVPTSTPTAEADNPENSGIHSISYDLYEVKASKREGNVKAGTKYSVKLTANSGFKLDPLNVAVRVNGDYVTSGYSFNEGLLEIDSVDGDIVIEAIAVQSSSSKKNTTNKNTNKGNTTSSKTTGNNSTPSNNTSGGSKSTQALSNSGKSAQNYSTASYRAPKTGDTSIDIRYYGALALVFIGIGFIFIGKKYKRD